MAISINTVSGDDVINAAEKGADLTLSGSTSGVEPGQTVSVTLAGKTYTATVAGEMVAGQPPCLLPICRIT